LLVLGQVPGTNFQITLNEMVITFLLISGIYIYRKHKKTIRRRGKWAWYRIGVNYRKQKRSLTSFIRRKQYRLAVHKRRVIRKSAIYILHKEKDVVLAGRRTKRKVKMHLRHAYRYILNQTYFRFLKFINRTLRAINRQVRAVKMYFYRRYSLLKRAYYIKLLQYDRMERRIKKSKAFQTTVKSLVKQP
jgi:hypothetical protein